MTSLRGFLSNIQSKSWKELSKSTVNKIVLGNEACDLDSAVSAVIYAYFLQSMDKKMEFGVVLPILNIEKKDYPLRTEVSYWLKKYLITEEMLLFRDDVDLKALANDGNLQLYIVDHNILSTRDADLDPFVVSILDHHQLEKTDTPVYGMTVEPVGSCATLVTSEILSKNVDILSEDVASLLYGTILLDTVNLSETAKRMMPKDVEMIECLEKCLNVSKNQRSLVYEELITAKSDISLLDSEQIFRKDVKIVSANNICVAISSVPLLVKKYLLRENIDECLHNISESFGYDVIVLMGIDLSGQIERDIAVISHRATLRKELSDYLTNGRSCILNLEAVEDCSNKDCNVFNQCNLTASRKVVLPLVRAWLDLKK